MGGGRRRSLRRACAGAAAVCAALSFAAPVRAQEEEAGPRPEVFRGAATSGVASVEVDRDALLPVNDVFRFVALDGSTVFETDLQTARASLLYPGEGLIQGPNLVCGTFGSQFPPQFGPILQTCTQYDYPLSVRADSSHPSRATTGALTVGAPTDPVSANLLAAKANATPEASASYAALEDLRVLGLPAFGSISLLPTEQLDLDPSILLIENATSTTDQHIDATGSLIVDAESVLSGVSLVGGLVKIGSIRSLSHVTDDAAGHRTSDASLEIAGVTVGGVPAQITEDGLVLGSPAGGSGPLVQQLQTALNQLLEALNVKITLLDVEKTVDDGTGQAVAAAGGVLVEVTTTADGLPTIPGPLGELDPNGEYVGSIQLGNTAASSGAVNFADEVIDFTGDLSSDFGEDVPFTGGDDFTFDVASPDYSAPASPVLAAPSGQAVERHPQQLVRRLTDTFGGRMGLLYLAFAFAVLSACLLPQLTIPARFPGAHS